jgi:predicted metal-dependent phosphoesterase TrpH
LKKCSGHDQTYTPGVLGAADLHLHTRASDGLVAPRDLVDFVELATDLDLIAITDHDEMSGSLDGREWAARQAFRVEVVSGVEVTTLDGHLLALFIDERPPALRSLQHTAEWVRSRGGLCVAPHPFTRWTHSLNRRALSEAIAADLIAGVEVLNASLAGRASRPHALGVARQHGLAEIGASDAHMASMVGLARTRFPGRSAADLRAAIESAATHADGRFATPAEMAAEAIPQLARSMVHLPLRRIVRYARSRRVPKMRTR